MHKDDESRLHTSRTNPGDEQRNDVKQTGENLCWDCKGSGKRDGERCPTCGGSGKVVVTVGDA